MSNLIVPMDEGQFIITEQMRKDAAAAAGDIESEGRLPHLYLCQATSDLVRQKKANDGDYVISTGDDSIANVGPAPLFIVLAAQTRYHMQENAVNNEGKKYRKTVWDAAKGELTPAQDADVGAKRAKRYTAFILIHVGDTKIDPHGMGPVSFRAKGMNTLAGMKWADAVANVLVRGAPPYSVAWMLGCTLEDSTQGDGKWNVLTYAGPRGLKLSDPTAAKLRESWQHAQAINARNKKHVITNVVEGEEEHVAALADQAAEQPEDSGYGDEPEGDYSTKLEPDVPDAALRAKYDWNTPILCGKDSTGIMMRKPVPDMSLNEATVAARMALPHVQKDPRAAGAAALVEAWAHYKGWNTEDMGFAPF